MTEATDGNAIADPTRSLSAAEEMESKRVPSLGKPSKNKFSLSLIMRSCAKLYTSEVVVKVAIFVDHERRCKLCETSTFNVCWMR